MVAVFAIGIFALPSTIAMFGGQHNWYDISPPGNQVPCAKCHADIADEMSLSGAHRTFTCDYCHRTDDFIGYASGDGTGSTPGEKAHAASTEDCMICHDANFGDTNFTHVNLNRPSSDCSNCHAGAEFDAPTAGGLNISSAPYDTGEKAAHKPFVNDAINNSLMVGANEACITCHTHVAIDINWSHKYKLSLDADGSNGGNWTVDNFFAEGTYNVTTYGNMSGQNTGVTDAVVEISPTPPGYDAGAP